MTRHAKDALRRSGVAKVLNLALAIPAFETGCTICLIPGEDSQIFDFVATCTTAIGTIIAD